MRRRLEYVVDWVPLRSDVDKFDDAKFVLPLRRRQLQRQPFH
jgi:hypothetical protein